MLCPWARHFTPRKYWLITQEAVAPSPHDWKIVDWDVKPQHKQIIIISWISSWLTYQNNYTEQLTGWKSKVGVAKLIYWEVKGHLHTSCCWKRSVYFPRPSLLKSSARSVFGVHNDLVGTRAPSMWLLVLKPYSSVKYIWVVTWQNQQSDCAPSKDSDHVMSRLIYIRQNLLENT